MIIFFNSQTFELKKKIIFVLPRFMYVAIVEIIIYLQICPETFLNHWQWPSKILNLLIQF
jgi:hypothetical protein